MEGHLILLAFLAEHQELKLNARVWLQEIINQIGKRFSKQNHEISHEWNSIYDSFDGVLDTNIGRMPAKFNLWRQPAANYRELGTWGGTAVLTEALRLDKMMQLREGTIFADRRSSGYAVVNRVDGAIDNLQGSGEHPEKQPDDVAVYS